MRENSLLWGQDGSIHKNLFFFPLALQQKGGTNSKFFHIGPREALKTEKSWSYGLNVGIKRQFFYRPGMIQKRTSYGQ